MDPHAAHESADTVSLFGKLSTTADFVRIHHTSDVAIELDVWLSSALQELQSAQLRWPQTPLRFVFLSENRRTALTGVIMDSRDRAGRKFPLTVYRNLPLPALVAPRADAGTLQPRALAALPRVTELFHDAVEAALPELTSMTREQAATRMRELETPLPAFGTVEDELAATFNDLAAAEFERRLFVGDVPAQARDAYDTTCQAARRAERCPTGATTAVDFPIRSTQDACAWLTLWAQLLPVNAPPPSCLWSSALHRLLVVHGPLPAGVPLWLAAPNKLRNQRIEVGVRYAFAALDPSSFQAGVAETEAASVSLLDRFEQTRRACSGGSDVTGT